MPAAALPYIATAATVAGTIGGLKGNKGGEQRQSQIEGFSALPKEVQNAYLQKFLPDLLAQYKNGPTPPPLGRAHEGQFESKGLQELQRYVDDLAQQREANAPAIEKQRQAQQAQQEANRASQATNDPWPEQRTGGKNAPSPEGLAADRAAWLGRHRNDQQPVADQFQEVTRDIIGNPIAGGYQQAQGLGNALAGYSKEPQTQNVPNGAGSQLAQNNAIPATGNGTNINTGGVRPISVVEPLNDIQRSAIGQAAQGHQANGVNDYINPWTQQALGGYSQLAAQGIQQGNPFNQLNSNALGGQLGGYLNAIGAPSQASGLQGYLQQLGAPSQGSGLGGYIQQQGGQIGSNGGIGSLQDYMNPYTDQVTNRVLARMKQQLEGGENSILGNASRLGGLGAFGSSALGTLLANRQNEALQRSQDFLAQQGDRNYGQAQQQRNYEIERAQSQSNLQNQAALGQSNLQNQIALGQRNSDVNQGISLQNQYLQNLGGQGNQAYALGGQLQNQGYGQQRQSLQEMLASGNQLQAQHQNELGAANQLLQQQLPQNRLNQLGSHLAMFPGSGQSFNYGEPQQNAWSKLGSAGQVAAGLGQSIAGWGNNGNVGTNAMAQPYLQNRPGNSGTFSGGTYNFLNGF